MNQETIPAFEAELALCATNFVYFCEKYVKINHPKNGLVPFTLYDYQKRYVQSLEDHRFLLGVKFRQGGFTTLTAIWLMWRVMFKSNERNMAIARTDREATYICLIVRQVFENLPDFLKPDLKICNTHEIHVEGTNSRLSFCTPQACCGKSINYLFIDEAAFILSMDEHWKAMLPTISTGGHCIVLSTTNGVGNWFNDLLDAAKKGTNEFHIFECSYTEHPDYNNPEWVEEMKKNLGERRWRQEILCEFLLPEPEKKCNEEKPKDKDFKIVHSLQEEAELLHKFRKKAFEQRQKVGKKHNQLGNVNDNEGPFTLLHERDKSDTSCNIVFDHVNRPQTFRSYYWADVAEEIAEEHIFVDEDYSLAHSIERKRENLRDLEDRVGGIVDDDLLVMAGVITESEKTNHNEVTQTTWGVDQEVLEKVLALGKFPDDLKVDFKNNKFCVNGTQTNIKEYDICCLYAGLAAFTSHEKAVEKVAKVIYKRMAPLFEAKETS
jgi:hypothetical protein